MEHLSRWPLLLAACVLAVLAVGLDVSTSAGTALAVACLAMAAAAFGAFLYAEGARHREWWDGRHRDDTPADPPG